MDQQALVNRARATLAKIESEYGPVALFMLLSTSSDVKSLWNVVVSCHGYNRLDFGAGFKHLTDALWNDFSPGSWSSVARTTILKTHDPFVRAINKAYTVVGDSDVAIQSCTISDIEIPYALLLRSETLTDDKAAAVLSYLQREFTGLKIFEISDPSSRRSGVRIIRIEGESEFYLASFSYELLDDFSETEIVDKLRLWKVSQLLRRSPDKEVLITTAGPQTHS